ncbi:hypothetical protein [Desulfonatronum thioautotrophicum]|uniref:hypothetical protein n=1 Tax=Desulfonatronum thioautotrophicum TaxID=617001 RepID=UPI0005EB236F|nr:hypothetical protein [Desulfonatronum thioautotrophicum]
MGKDDKINLILMRDDSRVRRFRLRVFWIWMFLCALVVLTVVALGGAATAIYTWGNHLEMANENAELRDRLAQQSFELERLKNVQEILKTNDPVEMHDLFNTVTRERASLPQVVNLQDLFVTHDLEMAGVNNLQLQKAEESLRISFELNNLSDDTLSGSIRVYFITQEASVIEAQGDENELSFEIQRFRRVNSPLRVPTGMDLEVIFAIRIVIQDNDAEKIFIQTYPVANILTT